MPRRNIAPESGVLTAQGSLVHHLGMEAKILNFESHIIDLLLDCFHFFNDGFFERDGFLPLLGVLVVEEDC